MWYFFDDIFLQSMVFSMVYGMDLDWYRKIPEKYLFR